MSTLVTATPADFDALFALLEKSFPLDEYRPREAQRALLDNPRYTPLLLREGETVRALVTLWRLGDFLYIEHLAVAPEARNGGLGSKILQMLRERFSERICLEVELPETDLAKRRIGFYERNGFSLNNYPYVQPPYGEGRRPIPLLIMTTGGTIDAPAFEALRDALYREVYGISTTEA